MTDNTAEISIYGEIGYDGFSATEFTGLVAPLAVDEIQLHINSGGGSVYDGIAIFNVLRRHRATVHVTVDGIAASIASVIAMAGDTVTMGRGTEMMIHNPSAITLGTADDLRETADTLDKIGRDIAGFYQARAGGTLAHWQAAMTSETWYSAQEAVDAGLADSVITTPARVGAAVAARADGAPWSDGSLRDRWHEWAAARDIRMSESGRSDQDQREPRTPRLVPGAKGRMQRVLPGLTVDAPFGARRTLSPSDAIKQRHGNDYRPGKQHDRIQPASTPASRASRARVAAMTPAQLQAESDRIKRRYGTRQTHRTTSTGRHPAGVQRADGAPVASDWLRHGGVYILG